MSEYAEGFSNASDMAGQPQVDPSSMPEISRELTMLRGAVTSLRQRVADLCQVAEKVSRPKEDHLDKLAVAPERFPVTTELGMGIREIYEEVSHAEDMVASVLHRIQL